MSGKVVTTASPLMMRIRSAMLYHCSRTGPMSSLDLSCMLRIREDVAYRYMRQLEKEGLAYVAAWRLEDNLSRFQDVPEYMPGQGERANRSVRSRRDTEIRTAAVIETEGEVFCFVPLDTISLILSGIKQHAVEA